MKIDEKILIEEIKTLKKASEIHTKYSIAQYKKVLKLLEELEKEKESLEKKVKERTKYLKKEMEENQKLTQKLKELAKYDPLTKLLNRRAFVEKLNELKNEDFSVMFLDLDGFKQVNDIYGHKTGDELLKIISIRIINALRKEDIVGRIGGDEFVVILKDEKSSEDLKIIAKKLIEKISAPIIINTVKIKVGTSIGIYIYNKKDPINKVLSFADSAMYVAKKSGKGKYVFFSESLNKEYIKQKFKKALKENKLKKVFYPLFYNDKLFAVEVSIELNNISFKEILDVLGEDKELLEELTLFMFKNINQKSLITVHYKIFNEKFLEKLKKLNLNISNIYLSIDSCYLKYIKKDMLKKFSNLGFKIILNRFEEVNFGLSYLEYSVNAVKIDTKIDDNEKTQKIFKGFLEIAKSLNIKVIIKSSNAYLIKN